MIFLLILFTFFREVSKTSSFQQNEKKKKEQEKKLEGLELVEVVQGKNQAALGKRRGKKKKEKIVDKRKRSKKEWNLGMIVKSLLCSSWLCEIAGSK